MLLMVDVIAMLLSFIYGDVMPRLLAEIMPKIVADV